MMVIKVQSNLVWLRICCLPPRLALLPPPPPVLRLINMNPATESGRSEAFVIDDYFL